FFSLHVHGSPISLILPYTTLFRSRAMAARALRRLLKSVRMSAALATPDSLATRGIDTVCGPSMEAVTPHTRTSPESERLDDLTRSEEHTSELQSPYDIVCRLLFEI